MPTGRECSPASRRETLPTPASRPDPGQRENTPDPLEGPLRVPLEGPLRFRDPLEGSFPQSVVPMTSLPARVAKAGMSGFAV